MLLCVDSQRETNWSSAGSNQSVYHVPLCILRIMYYSRYCHVKNNCCQNSVISNSNCKTLFCCCLSVCLSVSCHAITVVLQQQLQRRAEINYLAPAISPLFCNSGSCYILYPVIFVPAVLQFVSFDILCRGYFGYAV